MNGSEHTWRFRWFWSDAVIFRLFKVFSSSLQHIWLHTGQTFAINWSKIQLSWVLMLYYPYKMMFSVYKSVIVSPCACYLFVSKVTKITWYMNVRFWRSFFGAFSVCDDCILKSTTAWLLKLSVLYIHSFMQVHNTTFQIKTVFNNVLFSTEVHNPLHAHLLALSHMYISCHHLFWKYCLQSTSLSRHCYALACEVNIVATFWGYFVQNINYDSVTGWSAGVVGSVEPSVVAPIGSGCMF